MMVGALCVRRQRVGGKNGKAMVYSRFKVNKEGVMQGARVVSHGPETGLEGCSRMLGCSGCWVLSSSGGDLWPVRGGRP